MVRKNIKTGRKKKPASKAKGAKKAPHKRKKTLKPKKIQKRSFLQRMVRGGLKWGFVLGLWGGIALTGVVAWYAQDLPDITKHAGFERKRAIIVKDANGKIVARYGDIVGNKVSVADLPPHLIQAVLSIEDRRFYHHIGLDPLGLARAMFVNAKERRVVQGGSTITQQLAKNLFLSRERTMKRKIQEALLAFWLEYELTKDEILSAYLNRVYLGAGTYGVDAASKLYFGEPVGALTLRQSATLAALLKAPSRYSPLRNPGLSKRRTDLVLSAMVDAGYISKAQAEGNAKRPPKPVQKPSSGMAEKFFADWIIDQLDDLIGTPEEDLIIETTLNTKIQNLAAQALDRTIARHGAKKDMSEGAMILMRPNGQVVALVGGRNYNRSQFNRATQALRPPGSAFKPVVYLTALEQGWSPQDLIDDAPITDWRYRPKNFGGKYHGEVTLEEALTYSMNTAAVRLMKETGPSAVLNTAERLGITSKLEPDLSLALGSSGISLLEMATAYSVIANGGLSVEPFGINKITAKDGTLYYQRPRTQKHKRVFSAFDIQDLTRMMGSVMEYGTGRGAAFGAVSAGKTGTSQGSRDALFMGFTRELVGVVWLGNDDNTPMKGVTGGSFPARLWREVMSKSQGRYAALSLQSFRSTPSFEMVLENLFPGYGTDQRGEGARRRHKTRTQDKTRLPESSRSYNN